MANASHNRQNLGARAAAFGVIVLPLTAVPIYRSMDNDKQVF